MNILRRVSVRRYADRPVDDEQVSALLHAAMSAPSGVNRQPWEFMVVDDPVTLKRLADALPYAKMAAEAPGAIGGGWGRACLGSRISRPLPRISCWRRTP